MLRQLTLRERSDERAIQEWLESTYLSVRMQKNPSHYTGTGSTSGQVALSEVKGAILSNALDELQKHGYITRDGGPDGTQVVSSTELGEIDPAYARASCIVLLLIAIESHFMQAISFRNTIWDCRPCIGSHKFRTTPKIAKS